MTNRYDRPKSPGSRFATTKAAWTALALAGLGAMAPGCARHAAGGELPIAAKVEGDSVTFPRNAPQLSYVAVDEVRPHQPVEAALTGRLAWDDDVTARVFASVSGRIVKITAEPGQNVQVGDALAYIRSPDFGQAQADAAKAAADLTLAERSLRRERDLLDHHAAAVKDVESAEADFARAESEKLRADATLAIYGGGAAGVDGLFALKSPVPGVVVEKAVSPGQEVRSDQIGDKPLFVVSDPRQLWLYLDMTETDAVRMQPNQSVSIHVRGLPGRVFAGRLQNIGAGLDPTTRTIKARCLVDNSERLLRAEMYVTADVAEASGVGVDVPSAAVFLNKDRHFVFVESSPGQFQRRQVRVGPETNERVVIERGLAAGERVVVDGCLLLEAMLEGGNS